MKYGLYIGLKSEIKFIPMKPSFTLFLPFSILLQGYIRSFKNCERIKTALLTFLIAFACLPLVSRAEDSRPSIDFYANVTTGCPSLSVTFFDDTFEDFDDPIVSWEWDFGDGTSSTDFNPTHVYTSEGNFTVKHMVVTQAGVKDTATKINYIRASNSFHVDLGPDTLVCAGASVMLNATVPGASSYLWSESSSTPEIEAYFPGEYTVEVTKDGCVARDTINITHGALIYAEFSVDITPGCTPVKAAFTESSESCNSPVNQWSWDFGDGKTSTERNPDHYYDTPGDYTVTLTAKTASGLIYTSSQDIHVDGTISPAVELGPDIMLCEDASSVLSAGNPGADYNWSTGAITESITITDEGKYSVMVTKDGCSTEDSVKVIVVPELQVNFVFEKETSCLPVKIKFTDKTIFCQGSISKWYWEFGDGSTSTEQNPEHEFLRAGEFPVRLTIDHSDGTIIKKTKKVTITPISYSVNLGADTTICFGENITLDAGMPGSTYLWSNGETTQQIVVQEDGNYAIKMNFEGCEAKDTIHINTTAAAIVKFGFTKGAPCLPVAASFSDSTIMGCGQTITEWKWEFGDGEVSYEQHPVHSYTTADSFIVRLTVTTSAGGSVTRAKKIGITNTLHTLNLPESINVCRGSSAQLDAQVNDAEYTWTPWFGLNDTDIKDPVVTPVTSSLYKVMVTKCGVTVTDSVYVIVDSISKPAVSQSGNLLKAPDAHAYQWYRDGNIISGGINRTQRADRVGYYQVKVINDGGCENVSDKYFYLPQSRQDKKDEAIRVVCSPNPTRGVINIMLSEIPAKPVKVTVIDASGKRRFSTEIKDHINSLGAARLSKGMYFVELIINNKRQVIAVMVY